MFSSSIIIGRFRFFMICGTYFAFGTSSTHSKNVFFKSVESLEHMAKWCWASHPKVTGSSPGHLVFVSLENAFYLHCLSPLS